MVNLRKASERQELRNICSETNVKFLEFVLFSSTRFIQYVHRTYEVVLRLYSSIFTLYQNHASSIEANAMDAQHFISKISQAKFVAQLNFMLDLSKILTTASKLFQRDEVLPWRGKSAVSSLIENLANMHECLRKKSCPSSKEWSNFKTFVNVDLAKMEFQGQPLLLEGEQGRRLRSVRSSSADNENIIQANEDLKNCLYNDFVKYTERLICRLKERYLPWPMCLNLTE